MSANYAGDMRALKAWVERDGGGGEEKFKREVQLAAMWAPTSEFVRAALKDIH